LLFTAVGVSADKPLKCRIYHLYLKPNVVFSHPPIRQEGRKDGRKGVVKKIILYRRSGEK